MKAPRIRVPASFDFTHTPPIDIRRISVLLIASHHAALAPDALSHVKVKRILLAGQQCTLRDSRRIGSKRRATLRNFDRSRAALRRQQEEGVLFFRSFE
jgi:hypothetical protein